MAHCVGDPKEFDSWCARAVALLEHRLEVVRPGQSPAAGQPLARQRPPCLDGTRTVRRLRPFLRRRLKTWRPQRVFMRARKPCFAVRRLLRGRYVGCIVHSHVGAKAIGARARGSRLTFPQADTTFVRPVGLPPYFRT